MPRKVLFGSYELVDRIGEGGMAEVWLARSRGVAGFEKMVVIKRVLPSLMAHPDFARLLIREAKIAARLNHPNVVQIHELGEEQGAYYIAMEYVPGRDLASALTWDPSPLTKEGLTLVMRLWIVHQACLALHYAHEMRSEDGRPLSIVHRDVSPQNILLGYQGQVKVGDFGIARADASELGRDEDPTLLRGKYAYMSPEQARGEALDSRSDVFALGIVLYESVCGKRLFKGKDKHETLSMVKSMPVPRVDWASVSAPPLLADIIEKALHRDVEHRYASAAAMGEDLSDLLDSFGVRPDASDLANVLTRMAPPDSDITVNKLRVDLLRRSLRDEQGRAAVTDATVSLPTSHASKTAPAVLVKLAAGDDPNAEQVFQASIELFGGVLVSTNGSSTKETAQAAFATTSRIEHAAVDAILSAIKTLEVLPEASVSLRHGDVTMQRSRVVVADTKGDEPTRSTGCWCDSSLVEEVAWRFDFETPVDGMARLVGLRTRAERDAAVLRRQGHLIGRRGPLRELGQALIDLSEGHAGCIALLGEAGVGKTRLLAEIRSLATSQRLSFVSAHGRSNLPQRYGTLRQIFCDLCGIEEGDSPEVLRKKVQRTRVLGLSPREVMLVYELVGISAQVSNAGRPKVLSLVSALQRCIKALAQDAPVVLVIEDVQWVDEQTKRALPLLMGGLADAPVLCITTARPGYDIPLLPGERMDLLPLDGVSSGRLFVRRLARRGEGIRPLSLEDNLIPELMRQCGGLPRLIDEYARAVTEDIAICGDVVHELPEHFEVSDTVKRSESRMLTSLSPANRKLLSAIAVFPDGVDVLTLASVIDRPIDQVTQAVHRMRVRKRVRCGNEHASSFWCPGPWGGAARPAIVGKLRFRSQIEQTALLSGLSNEESQSLHDKVARTLVQAGAAKDGRVHELAYHATKAGQSEAADYLVRAAELAQTDKNPQLAAQLFEQALAVLSVQDQPVDSELWLRSATAWLVAGDLPRCVSAVRASEKIIGLTLEARVGLKLLLATVFRRREDWAAVIDVLDSWDSEQADEEFSVQSRMEGLLMLGHAHLSQGDVSSAIRILESTAMLSHDRGTTAITMSLQAIALSRVGKFEQAHAMVHEALVIATCNAEPRVRFAALVACAESHDAQGQYELAGQRWCDAVRVAQAEGYPESARAAAQAALSFFWTSDTALTSNRSSSISDAAMYASEAIELGALYELSTAVALGSIVRAGVAMRTHPELKYVRTAVQYIDELAESGRSADVALGLTVLARLHLLLDDVPAAIRTMIRAKKTATAAGFSVLAGRCHAELDRLARGDGSVAASEVKMP